MGLPCMGGSRAAEQRWGNKAPPLWGREGADAAPHETRSRVWELWPMNQERFDELAKGLATSRLSRWQVLKAVGATAVLELAETDRTTT